MIGRLEKTVIEARVPICTMAHHRRAALRRTNVPTPSPASTLGPAPAGHWPLTVGCAHGVELALSLRPDVVLMDWRMPHLDGLAATHRLLLTATWGQGPAPRPMAR
jgi:CheY-like chemotaxis protein